MGLYTDPNYFEKQANYQRRKIKKVVKAVSVKREPHDNEDQAKFQEPVEQQPIESLPASPDLTQMTQEEYDAFMMGMTVEQYRIYQQMVLKTKPSETGGSN